LSHLLLKLTVGSGFVFVHLGSQVCDRLHLFGDICSHLVAVCTQPSDQNIILLRFLVKALNYFLGFLEPLSLGFNIVLKLLYRSLELIVFCLFPV